MIIIEMLVIKAPKKQDKILGEVSNFLVELLISRKKQDE